MNKNPKMIFILGMHRSGTSCLAGCLERCGVYLGDVNRTSRFNAKGNHEIKEINRLNDQILAMNKGSWNSPPEQVFIHDHHRQQLKIFVDQLEKHKTCGLKDPRLLLMLDDWMELISHSTQLVATFRHPESVASSLFKRSGITKRLALDLWLSYNSKLVEYHKKEPFPIIEYDLSNITSYLRKIETLAITLELSKSNFRLRRFVSKKLEHNSTANYELPLECKHIFNYLCKHSLTSTQS